MPLNDSDKLLINAGNSTETISFKQFKEGSMLNETDKFLINDGIKTETITWEELQAELYEDAAPVIGTAALSEDDTAGDRFTNQSFTTRVVMSEDGRPPSSKGIRAKVGNDLKYKFGPIQSVNDKTVTYSDPANFNSSNDTVRTPEDAFNGTFGNNGSEDFNFADTENQGMGKQIEFTFPEPLFVDPDVEFGFLSDKATSTVINYVIDEVEYSGSIHAQNDYGGSPTLITLAGGLTCTIFYVRYDDNKKDVEAYQKYLEPYFVPGNSAQCKAKYMAVFRGPFRFLKFTCISQSTTQRAKVFGFWLGDHWLDDSLGATELFFDDSLANDVANVKTTDTVNEVGNGDDGVGSVAFTQYIGDELGSTQNKIVLSQIEPNWDAGSDLSSPADTAFQYLVLDNDLNVTGLQADKPDFTPFTGLAAQIQFGSNLGTADTPDTVLPEGTSIGTEVQATNSINPDSTKESNLITPEPCVSGDINTDELIGVSADGLTLTFDGNKDLTKFVPGSSIEQTPDADDYSILLNSAYDTDFNSTGAAATGNLTVDIFDSKGDSFPPEIVTLDGFDCIKFTGSLRKGSFAGSGLYYENWSNIDYRTEEIKLSCWFYLPTDFSWGDLYPVFCLIYSVPHDEGRSHAFLEMDKNTKKIYNTNLVVPLGQWNKYEVIQSPSSDLITYILNDDSESLAMSVFQTTFFDSQSKVRLGISTADGANGTRVTPKNYYVRDLVITSGINPSGVVQETNSDTNQIALASKTGEWGPASSGYSAKGYYQCPIVFTPLYLENPEDAAKFNAIKESLDSYEGDRLDYRAELRRRLLVAGFTVPEIETMNLIDDGEIAKTIKRELKRKAKTKTNPVESKRKRVRNEDGTYKGDDLSTPDANEAWEDS